MPNIGGVGGGHVHGMGGAQKPPTNAEKLSNALGSMIKGLQGETMSSSSAKGLANAMQTLFPDCHAAVNLASSVNSGVNMHTITSDLGAIQNFVNEQGSQNISGVQNDITHLSTLLNNVNEEVNFTNPAPASSMDDYVSKQLTVVKDLAGACGVKDVGGQPLSTFIDSYQSAVGLFHADSAGGMKTMGAAINEGQDISNMQSAFEEAIYQVNNPQQ